MLRADDVELRQWEQQLPGYESSALRRRHAQVPRGPAQLLSGCWLHPFGIQMRSGRLVGNAPPSISTNLREDVVNTLDRLHLLWSINNADYNREYPAVRALPANRPVPAAAIPRTLAAIRQNKEPTLHARVVEKFLTLRFADNVGRSQMNNRGDILRLQYSLRALGFLRDTSFLSERTAVTTLTTARVPEGTIPDTLDGISCLKDAIAGGRLGWAPIHADEDEAGGDRYGGQTHVCPITSFSISETGVRSPAKQIDVCVFLPRGANPDSNKIHVFFSPGGVKGDSGLNAALTHGLRGASDASDWILIGVPAEGGQHHERGFHTISIDAILNCLERVGRARRIDSLRLSAHSRGYRGLMETIQRRLINLALVDRVIILDANHNDIANVLRGSGIRANKVIAYGVTTGNLPLPGSRTIRLPAGCMRAIGYCRLIQDAMVTRPSLPIPAAVRNQLLTLQPRGRFTTSATPNAGQVSLIGFCNSNGAAINTIVRQESDPAVGLKRFLDNNDLVRFGGSFTAGIYSHHFFVAEIAHELTA